MEDGLVISGHGALDVKASALYARFLHQPLKIELKKIFDLLWCQESDGDVDDLACRSLDPYAVRVLGILRLRNQCDTSI